MEITDITTYRKRRVSPLSLRVAINARNRKRHALRPVPPAEPERDWKKWRRMEVERQVHSYLSKR